jgi:hypothetical protein
MIEVYCKSIQLSLAVVADVRDGEMIEGMDDQIALRGDESKASKANDSRSTPLNVNTGAIGANGTFTKLTNSETERRLAIQRIVVSSPSVTQRHLGD